MDFVVMLRARAMVGGLGLSVGSSRWIRVEGNISRSVRSRDIFLEIEFISFKSPVNLHVKTTHTIYLNSRSRPEFKFKLRTAELISPLLGAAVAFSQQLSVTRYCSTPNIFLSLRE